MSLNICRGTLGNLAMFTAIRNASDAGNIYLTMMDRKRPKRLRRPQRFSDC
jgi:hypothetical protein